MRTIDLHGVKHEDARRIIDRLSNSYYMGDVKGTIKIITGHSPTMLDLVTGIFDEYMVDYEVGDPLGIDNTFVTIS